MSSYEYLAVEDIQCTRDGRQYVCDLIGHEGYTERNVTVSEYDIDDPSDTWGTADGMVITLDSPSTCTLDEQGRLSCDEPR